MTKLDPTLDKNIGNYFRSVRTLKNISIREMCKNVGVTYQMYRNYEVGKVSFRIDQIVKICEILKINSLEILEILLTGRSLDFDSYPVKDKKVQLIIDLLNKIEDEEVKDCILFFVSKFVTN